VNSENGQIGIRLPYLATIDRNALQAQLGNHVRVSRVAVWFPYEPLMEEEWQRKLLDILGQLSLEKTVSQ